MFTFEPPRTAYDVTFRCAGFPVRVHPMFWLVSVLMGASGGGEDAAVGLVAWVAVVFVSILVHELGHALAMRYFGEGARIVLHAFGGLAIADSGGLWSPGRRQARAPMEQVLIYAAGPGAGFLLAAIVVAVIVATGGQFRFEADFPIFWSYELADRFAGNDNLDLLVWFLLQVNILWGVVNLLPVFPLDGGQICRQLLILKDPWQGELRSLWVSVITAGAVAAWSLYAVVQGGGSLFTALMFGSLAMSSYMAIQQMRGGGFGGGRPW